MRTLHVLSIICAAAVVASCSSPEAVTPEPEAPDVADAADDADFDIAELRAGEVRVRNVSVPAGYTLVDMNDRGDLLLGNTWLPKGKKSPQPLPFIGRSISNRQHILGPDLSYFDRGRVVTLPSPCTSFGTPPFVFDCSNPAFAIAQAENGDILATYRQDAPGTQASPYRYLTVWREQSQTWEELVSTFGDGTSVDGIISDNGTVAGRVDNYPSPVVTFVQTLDNRFSIAPEGACPAPFPDAFELVLRAVNDEGEGVGTAVCDTPGGINGVGMRWSSSGVASPMDGFPQIIDNFGNAAGTLADGRVVVQLTDGTVIELAAAGSQAGVRKFLRRGQILGFIGTQPVVWRFGFPNHP